MERSETRAALRLLYAIALADGKVSPEEERALTVASEALGDELDTSGTIDVVAEASHLRSTTTKIATFEAAVALASVDGRCAPEEHALLERVRAALGVDMPLPVVEREARWADRMREARAAMQSAELDFLHTIAKKTNELSQDEYRGLVDDLHRAQVAALHETFDPALEGRPSYVKP